MAYTHRQGTIPFSGSRRTVRHAGYLPVVCGQLFTLLAAAVLFLVVWHHRGPLEGEVGVTLDVQHAILHTPLAGPIELVSTIGWPIPAAITVSLILIVLLVLRRWLDALILIPTSIATSLSNLYTADFVRRPRPHGHGIWIEQHVKNYFSFPSGHVVFVTAIWGFVFFLTFQSRYRDAAWLWIPRIVALVFIVVMPISRVLEGEHWPTDDLEGFLYGVFWLLLAIQIYWLGAKRFPGLLSKEERTPPGSTRL
jgi:membrane-associated phospholipid phosphatase